jgi:hypothetical protein
MFCVAIFNSYISFFIVYFVSLCCLLKSSLSFFICFCIFSCFLFWCLEFSWVYLVHSGYPCLVSSPWRYLVISSKISERFLCGCHWVLYEIYHCFVGVWKWV